VTTDRPVPPDEPGRLDALFELLWNDHAGINSHARAVHDLLTARGETVVNDHIALRTFDDPRVCIDVMARAFTDLGYRAVERYDFETKHLRARHYEHAEPGRPKVFISELDLSAFSDALRTIVARLLGQLPTGITDRADFVCCGRPWQASWRDYESLRAESEYAAWMAAFGFRANHFTVSVNHLTSVDGLARLNELLTGQGFELNTAGGAIKGSPEQLLEQSSTKAAAIRVQFSDRAREVPGCYYEFAHRHERADGTLFEGFIAESADRIFESTDPD